MSGRLHRASARLAAGALVLAGIAGVQVAVGSPAEAATWVSPPSAVGPRVCTSTRAYSDVSYQLCLDYQDQSHVAARPILFVYASVTSYAQVNGVMHVGGTTYSFSCPTKQVVGGQSFACYDAYRTISAVPLHSADATVGIDGSWRPTLRVQESRIRGTGQQSSNWCGPSEAQAALRIIGKDISQAALATALKTDQVGLTLPGSLAIGMNGYLAGYPNQYTVYNYGLDGTVYRMRKSIEMARPVGLVVRPGDLPGGNAAWYYRHWITMHGWAGQVNGADSMAIDQFVFFDPGSGREFAGINTTQINNAALSAGISPGELTFVAGQA